MGWRGRTLVCDGAHQRVPAGCTDWLAPRRPSVRYRRRDIVALVLSDEVPPVPAARPKCVARSRPTNRHSPDDARPTIRVFDDGRLAECLRTPHSCRVDLALFDNLPDPESLNLPLSGLILEGPPSRSRCLFDLILGGAFVFTADG